MGKAPRSEAGISMKPKIVAQSEESPLFKSGRKGEFAGSKHVHRRTKKVEVEAELGMPVDMLRLALDTARGSKLGQK